MPDTSDRQALTSDRRESSSALRPVALLMLITGMGLLARRLPVSQILGLVENRIAGLGHAGPIVYGLVYVAAVVAVAPASVLTLAAGALFGPVLGVVVVSLASTTGAALAFLIARHLAREEVMRRLRGDARFTAIDRAIGESGWKIVALLRLSPAVPFNLQNYLYGVTSIRFWPCVLTSWITMLPGTSVYVYIGYAGRAGLEAAASGGRTPAQWAMLAVGLLATIGVTVYVTRLARSALAQQSRFTAGGAGPDLSFARPPDTPRPPKSRAAGILLLLAALAVLGMGVYLQLNPGLIEGWLVQMVAE